MPATSTKLKSISVDIEVMTKDRLRKVVFGLDKKPAPKGDVQWTMNFELYERASKDEEFGEPIVNLDAIVVKAANFANAEATAASGKLVAAQTEHALGPAAVDAKRFKEGKIPRAKADATAERTLAKRSS
jgi:hypothetical protein